VLPSRSWTGQTCSSGPTSTRRSRWASRSRLRRTRRVLISFRILVFPREPRDDCLDHTHPPFARLPHQARGPARAQAQALDADATPHVPALPRRDRRATGHARQAPTRVHTAILPPSQVHGLPTRVFAPKAVVPTMVGPLHVASARVAVVVAAKAHPPRTPTLRSRSTNVSPKAPPRVGLSSLVHRRPARHAQLVSSRFASSTSFISRAGAH